MHNPTMRSGSLDKTEHASLPRFKKAKETLRPLLPVAMGLASILAGVLAGVLATWLSLQLAILILGGLVVFLIVFSRPEYAFLLVFVASSSIFHLRQVPNISLGFTFTAIEILLILLLGLVIAQALGSRTQGFVKTPLGLPIALFFLVTFLSLLNSTINLGTDVDMLEYQWRIMFSYLVFFAVTNLVRTRRQLLTLVVGMFVLATIVAVMMIAQQAVGTSVVILPGRVEIAGVFDSEFAGVTRILPPGQSLILVMFMPALILLITRQRLDRLGWLLLTSILALLVALAFTFNRNMWIGVIIAIIAMFLVSNRSQRRNLFLLGCVLVVLAAIVIPLMDFYVPQASHLVDALYTRGASLFTGDRVQYSSSWQWRVMENEYALTAIKRYPLLGIGPGNDYRPRIRLGGDSLTGYVHNSYLFILLDFGILGFLTFAWFSVLFLVRGYRLWPTIQDLVLRAVALGFTLAYIPMLVAGIAAPVFMAWYWTPVIGAMLGINEVIYRLNREAQA